MITGLAFALFGACSPDSPTEPGIDVTPFEAIASASVGNLAVSAVTDSTVTLNWTQVESNGKPSSYRVKYAEPPFAWSTATIGCDVAGTKVGAPASCTVRGLSGGTAYDFQLMSYRLTSGGSWQNAVYSNQVSATTTAPAATAVAVADLTVTAATDSSLTVRWTQVNDGTGQPADYRVKYATQPLTWSSASTGCSRVEGTAIGTQISCTIPGLAASTTYDVQLMSYRLSSTGTWLDAVYSNLTAGRTSAAAVVEAPQTIAGAGIWISQAEIAQLPTSGSAWNNLLATANSSCGAVDLTDQEDATNVCVMAKALVFARTGTVSYRTDVMNALSQIIAAPAYSGRALALGRELVSYVIAADLIGLKNFNPTLDLAFRTAIRVLRDAPTTEAGTLRECHERRPNNWGTHCGASRIAIDAYLGDTADLARAAQVFKGWLGDRASYSGFSYGDLSWQCDSSRPVGINAAGCTRNGHSIDGVIADDQRRAGSYAWPAPQENYVWEALQGALAQAVLLHRAGYPVWDWENRALLRAVAWLHNVNQYPADGDDTWQPHIINRFYGTSFPAPTPSRAGKNVGWTDWTHR
jgi:hypothetical protein